MSVRAALALLLAATSATASGQQDATGLDRRPPITARIERAPLNAAQRQEVNDAVAAHEYRKAESLLVEAIRLNPQSAELLLLAASVFLLDKEALNAAIAFKKADRIRPLSEPDRFALSISYVGMGRGEWARPELEKLAAANRANALYAYWLARIDYDERKYEAAIDRLHLVTKTMPAFIKAWDNLGLSQEGAGQLDNATASYEEATRLNREQTQPSPWPAINYGTLLTKIGQPQRGEKLLREAAIADPALPEVHYRLGINLHKQARNRAAIPELQQAVSLDRTDPRPLYALSQIYREEGDAKAAAEALERFKALKRAKRGE